MKCNPWTLALIGAGLVSLPAVTQADETASTNAVPSLLTSLPATTLSGYVDTSMHWNPGTGNANLPVYTPNGARGGSKADGFNLDLVNLTINHPVGEGDWAAGYNATLLFGPDAVGYNPSPGAFPSDLSLKDAYVELKAPLGNGLDFKLGTFTEILGYEVYETGNNPNYTRSFGYEIEPTALTGLLATYAFSPALTAMFGIANTWSGGIDSRAFAPAVPQPQNQAESFKTYMASLTFTAPKDMGCLAGSTLSGGFINGYDAANFVKKTSWYIGGTLNTPITNVKVGAAIDYVNLANNNIGGAANTAGYQGAYGLYLSWQATEKLGFYSRVEYLTQSSYLSGGGVPSSAFEFTESVQYDLWKNVLARAEFRWDHAEHGTPYGGKVNGALPAGGPAAAAGTFGDANAENEFLLALNFIYKF